MNRGLSEEISIACPHVALKADGQSECECPEVQRDKGGRDTSVLYLFARW
jgi:hypothetical protein